jgi:LAO/AO transport system kinase
LAEIWLPSVLRTIAIENRGIDELVEEIARHREWLKQNGNWGKKERQRIETDMVHMLSDRLFEKWQQKNSTELLQGKIDQVIERKCSPYQAVAELLD